MYEIEMEYTDTFGGEPNYCWVKRETLPVEKATSPREIMRRLKAFAGLTGARGRSACFGDSWEFRPYRMNTIAMARVVY